MTSQQILTTLFYRSLCHEYSQGQAGMARHFPDQTPRTCRQQTRGHIFACTGWLLSRRVGELAVQVHGRRSGLWRLAFHKPLWHRHEDLQRSWLGVTWDCICRSVSYVYEEVRWFRYILFTEYFLHFLLIAYASFHGKYHTLKYDDLATFCFQNLQDSGMPLKIFPSFFIHSLPPLDVHQRGPNAVSVSCSAG